MSVYVGPMQNTDTGKMLKLRSDGEEVGRVFVEHDGDQLLIRVERHDEAVVGPVVVTNP